MKPIQLKIAGLQSYRAEQVIDFSELCDAGVFGIFGPTGSGKSSILDAITLALYAKVERANNGTQGIMNHAENTLSVSFTFELTNASQTERYRVERQFKRLNEVSVSNTLSRFIHRQKDEDIVLADKLGEVNERVQQLLGLSVDDFTRAVVLPQGRFAEFLNLKGSERRQMLQRLFNLEKYGDLLQMKLNQLARQADVELKQLSAEQQGLGDASEAAVKAANDSLQKADELAKQHRDELATLEKRVKREEQIWAWQMQKASDEQQLEQLKAAQSDILALEKKAQEAAQAERLRPYVERSDAALAQLKQSSALLEQARLEQAEAKREHAVASETYAAAEQQRQANEATLLIQLNDYGQALQLEKELIPLSATLEEQEKAYLASDAHAKEQAQLLHKQRDALQQARTEVNALQEQLEQCAVPATTVRAIQSAHHDNKAMEKLELDRAKLSEQKQQQAVLITTKQKEIATVQVEYEQSDDKIQQAVAALVHVLHDLEAHNSALQSLVQRAEATQHLVQRHDEQHALQQQAIHLAQQLEAGERCPVCGATEHPQLAIAHHNEGDASYADLGTMQALLTSLRDHVFELKQTDFTIRTQLNGMTTLPKPLVFDDKPERNDELNIAESSESNGSSALSESSALSAPSEPSEKISSTYGEALQEEFSELNEELAQFKRVVSEQITIITNEQQLLNTISQRKNEQMSELKALEAVFVSRSEQLENTANELEQMKASWHERYPQFKLEQIDVELEQLEVKEKRAEELKVQLKNSEQTIEHTEATMQQSQQTVHELEKKLVQLAAQWDRMKEVHAEKRKQLQKWIGEAESAQHLIETTELKLRQLREAAQQAKEQLDERQQRLEAANSKFSAAEQAMATAQTTVRDAGQQLEQHIANTSFETSEAVREAFADEQTIQQWNERIKAHRDAEQQLSYNIKQLDDKLAGEQLSEKQWMDSQAQLQLAKEQVEVAIQHKAKAERDVEDVLQRHERWAELEANSKEVRHYIDMLSKLQKVFRGNAFVEYVAEEQLIQVSRAASERLGDLTRQRYAIEVDSAGGFIIRDDANGGVRRPASSLSGGETFLTSLALALALSAQIQLGGQYALEFFFLDEGFGTLDPHMLEGVITALEKLHSEHLNVGVISHVPQLRAHLPRKLIVHPAEPSGEGSTVSLETI